jgi:4-hydroxy-tetrahydrodipicolinate synthase
MLERTHGTFVVAQTPFDERGDIDLSSIDSLVDFYFQHGADGLTVLGISGEAARLTADEAATVAKRFIRRARGKPVFVGVTNSSLAQLAALTGEVMDHGAAGVMIAPPGGQSTDEAVFAYFEDVFSIIGPTPTVLQDYPFATGVAMSVRGIQELVKAFDQIGVLKHEDFPGLSKLSRLRQGLQRRIAILTGSNALFLPYELARGADGPMAGFSYPEVLSGVYTLHCAGRQDDAMDLFDRYLPLIRYEAQGPWGIAVRKEVLRRRGAIGAAKMRKPGPELTRTDYAELDMILRRLPAGHPATGLDFHAPISP